MDIDVNFEIQPQLSRHQVIQKYTNALKQIRTFAERSYNVSPFYFDNYVMFQYFQQHTPFNIDESSTTWTDVFKFELVTHFLDRRRRLIYWVLYVLLAYCCVFVYRHETSIVMVERSRESLASMRIWRRMTLPLIQRFPQLTELYDESCLMENPFFQIDDLSCEPCSHVDGVLDLTDNEKISPSRHQSTYQPFVFKVNQNSIDLIDIYNIYMSNHEIFQRDAYRVQSTNRDVTNLEELFSQFNNSYQPQEQQREYEKSNEIHHNPIIQTHNLWRCNRMLPARLLRQLFASSLPNNGIALERFVAIDTEQAPAYTLPHTECANVYVQQAMGTRYIILRPTSECRQKCRTISMRLKPSHVLNYNWLYWRPISTPDPVSEKISISLIGSYC